MKYKHDLFLRIGFGIFLAIWGIDRIIRASCWATESLMGSFYGTLGLMTGLIIILGVLQLLIALSFFTNFKVKYTSLLLFAMIVVSTLVTLRPMFNYLFFGGAPIPAILFADHFPLLAGAWAIYAHTTNGK